MRRLTYPSYDALIIEKKTFALHLLCQFFNGLVAGIIVLQEIILKKSLSGTDFEVTVLIYLTSISFLLSIYGSEIINRTSNKPRTLFIIGAIGRGALIFIPLFDNVWFYIFVISIMFIADALLLPAWNFIFKHNYTDQNRSKLYSYAYSFTTIVLLIVSIIAGFMLDENDMVYKLIFPIAGVSGILYYYYMSRIMKLGMQADSMEKIKLRSINKKLLKDILILPIRNSIRICKEDKRFFKFEVNFFLYGMAFMILAPAIPIFLVDYLNLDYTPISIAKGFIFHGALILATPFMGKILGVNNPTKFCGIVFLTLVSVPLLMLVSDLILKGGLSLQPVDIIYLTFFIFGVAMSGVTIAWNLGSIYYAPHNEVANYQAVHITLTGLRGSFAPMLGYFVIELFSIEANFILSAVLFAIAGTGMLMDYRKTKRFKSTTV
ncbi:MAG TPA: MFS transporter [Ignavibacteria bacterium]|nr:MFS transporter [Ignavibacteria bacterium]